MKRLKKIKKKKFLTAAALFLLLAAGYTLLTAPKEEEDVIVYQEEIVSFGDLTQEIMESGSIELQTKTQSYNVVIEEDEDDDDDDEDEDTRHLKIEDVYVKQGQRVREGDPIMKVTERSIRSVRRYLEAEYADAEIALEELQNEYEVERAEAGNAYQKSITEAAWSETQYAIDQAEIPLEIASLTDAIAALECEIKQLENELEDSWEDYASLKEEYEKYERRYNEWDKDNLYTYIPLRADYLNAKEKYETETENRLEKREEIADKQEEILEKLEETARLQGQIRRKELEARQTYETAALGGSMAQDVYTYSLSAIERNIDAAQKELDDISGRLSDFDAFAGEDGTVYAESDGLITQVYYEAGDILQEESALLTYVTEGSYALSIDILEEDIPYVEVGDAVTIVFTAYPDEAYTGIVEEIVTTETSANTATVSYPVTVRVEGDTTKLYGGMTGDVTFVTDEVSEAVYVSRKAVTSEDGKSYALMKDENGEMIRKEVETGFTDGANVQIVSGLSEGDVVYIASHVSAKAGGRDEELDQKE